MTHQLPLAALTTSGNQKQSYFYHAEPGLVALFLRALLFLALWSQTIHTLALGQQQWLAWWMQ